METGPDKAMRIRSHAMKTSLLSALLGMLLSVACLGLEGGLDFLSGIPELRELSLKMSEDELKAHVEKHGLYARKEQQKERFDYWVITPGGENVHVGFLGGKCTGIQRMQPVPKQFIKDEVGAAEYEAWMAKQKADPKNGAKGSTPLPTPAQPAAEDINAELARRNLEHFTGYLSKCPENEIRCLWFVDDRISVGMRMEIDLQESKVYTVRDVFNHALQNGWTRGMSHYQIVAAKEVLPGLPASTPGVSFAAGLHLSFWHGKKLHTVTYSKKAVPLLVQRLYDVGGGAADFTYVKEMP